MTIGEAVKERILQLCAEHELTINKLSTISGVTLISDDGTSSHKRVRVEDGGITFGLGNAIYGELTATGGLGDVYYNIGDGCRLIFYPGSGGGYLEIATKMVLRANTMYGTSLPASGVTGQLFFKI